MNTAAQVVQVPRLNFLARPGSLAQKSQAGFYAWVACETAHVNSLRQSFPAMSLHQDGQDGFKSHALKRIVRVLCHSIESSKFTSPQSQTARPNPTSFAAGQCRSRPLGVIPAHAASKNRHTAFIVRFMQSSLFQKTFQRQASTLPRSRKQERGSPSTYKAFELGIRHARANEIARRRAVD